MPKLVVEVKEFQEYRIDIDLSKPNDFDFILIKYKDRYFIDLIWENVVGVGTFGIYQTNDGINKWLMQNECGNNMELTINTANGNDYMVDYVGVLSKYMGIGVQGFTSGTIKGTIYFK